MPTHKKKRDHVCVWGEMGLGSKGTDEGGPDRPTEASTPVVRLSMVPIYAHYKYPIRHGGRSSRTNPLSNTTSEPRLFKCTRRVGTSVHITPLDAVVVSVGGDRMEHHVQPSIPLQDSEGTVRLGLWRCGLLYERVYLILHSRPWRVVVHSVGKYTQSALSGWAVPSWHKMSAGTKICVLVTRCSKTDIIVGSFIKLVIQARDHGQPMRRLQRTCSRGCASAILQRQAPIVHQLLDDFHDPVDRS